MTATSWLGILTVLSASAMSASTQASLTQLVQQAPTVTSVQSPTGLLVPAIGATLIIQVISSNGIIVSDGTVVLAEGSTAVGSEQLVNGQATIPEGFSSLGIHQVVACYSGDSNFSSSCSSPTTLTALAPYTLQQSKMSAVIENSDPFTDKLTVIPAKGFVGIVQLVCRVPSDQCRLSPASVSFSGDGRPQVVETSFIPSPPSSTAGFIVVPLMALIGFSRKRKWSHILIASITVTMVLGLVGCGPVVSVPLDLNNVTMRVNATSGSYSQSVMYQIQVDTVSQGSN